MWRILNSSEITQFQDWARNNYITGEPISHTWHPVVQIECVIMNIEKVTTNNDFKDLIDNMREVLLKI